MLKKAGLCISIIGMLGASVASAADMYVAQEFPPLQEAQPESGGWYLRGDINHHWSSLSGADYITYGYNTPEPGTNSFTWTDLKSSYSLGAGIGYQINRYFRTDLTVDYWLKSDFRGSTSGICSNVPCTSTDTSGYSALLLMANAYVDLGTYAGITPYIGAGIGGARVKWDNLVNVLSTGTDVHKGTKDWRFAWSLMAGASYCLTDSLQLDAGYRYTRINGGRMFEETTPQGTGIGVGPGFDRGINVHEARAGLRYAFNGPSLHCAPQQAAYELPVYEAPLEAPIYK